jgi:hypothetical protein
VQIYRKGILARKRKKLKNLDYTSVEYWNRLLVEEGLSLSAGLGSGKLVYVGDTRTIDRIQEDQSQHETGRTMPKPASP